jgi:hypothetical protein
MLVIRRLGGANSLTMAKNPVFYICLYSIRNINLLQSLIVESLPEVEDAVGDAEEDEGEGEVLQVRARLLQADTERVTQSFLEKTVSVHL